MHVVVRLAVLALQAFQLGRALPDLLQPLGVGGERLSIVADVPGELGELRRQAASPDGDLACGRIELGGLRERSCGRGDGIAGCVIVAPERGPRRSGVLDQSLDVREPGLLGRQAPRVSPAWGPIPSISRTW